MSGLIVTKYLFLAGSAVVILSWVNVIVCRSIENPLWDKPVEAVAAFDTEKHGKSVNGIISFKQNPGSKMVNVTGIVTGLSPGKHGLHISESGDMTNGCYVSGVHLNPHKTSHGAPTDKIRHVGDLGNIFADDSGLSSINFTDTVISLYPDTNFIIGRVLIVHEWYDDMGRGQHPDSRANGNAGGRVTCGIISYK